MPPYWTFKNCTNDDLYMEHNSAFKSHETFLRPSSSITVHSTFNFTKLTIRASPKSTRGGEKIAIHEDLSVDISLALNASWRVLKTPANSPWRVYRTRLSREHHEILIFPTRNCAAFLSEVPDSTRLTALTLPGTHDTMAFYGWPISQCQNISTPLAVQLNMGIRVLDIRLAVVKSRLISYHGTYPQRTPFSEILSCLHAFLTSPLSCRETIVMSMKQEDYPATAPPLFSALVKKEIEESQGGLAMWFLENRVPKLGEVRGKIIMFSRFGGDGDGWEGGLEGLGMHPTNWPDSDKSGFAWNCKDVLVMTHDWYNIPSFLSIPEKVELSTEVLLPPPHIPSLPPSDILAITYFSAAAFPLALPPTVARGFGWPRFGLGIEGVNARVGRWLLRMLGGEQEETTECTGNGHFSPTNIRGWALMDFCGDSDNAIPALLVEANFTGKHAI